MKRTAILTVMLAGLLSQSAFAQQDRRERAIREKLRTTRVSMDFTEAPLKDVVSFLQSVSGINLLIDPNIFKERTQDELRVSLTVKNITLENALALIGRFFKLHTDYRDGVLLLTNRKRAGRMKIIVYDIRDMMMKIRDFKGPDIKISAGNKGGTDIQFQDDPEPTTGVDKDTLLELLKDNTGDVWGDDHPNSGMSMIGGLLVVTHNLETQRKVSRLLAMMRFYR